MRDDPSLALGLNTHAGAITNAGVAEAHGRPVTSVSEVLGGAGVATSRK
jgi:alanine dehydrogenase